MADRELRLGRLIDHLHLVVADFEASKRFYAAALEALGIDLTAEGEDWFQADELFVSTATSRAASGRKTGRVHVAFQARDRATVDRFHAAGLEHGGADHGPPGERDYHPGYYAAFLLDPDGNNVEAVHHGPAERSADAVVIKFSLPS